MRKIVIGAVTAAGIVGGSIAVAAVNPFGIAGAQDGVQPPATTAPADPSTGADPAAGRGGGRGRGHGAPGQVLSETLDDLVAKGTITQEQADAVKNGVKDRVAGGHFGEGHGPQGAGRQAMSELFGTAAQALGLTTDELKTELRAGKSIADIARERGIDPQTVIDALAGSVDTKIDQAVADGKIPADRAADAKAKARERITEMVNNTGGAFKGHGHGRGHGKHHGDDDESPEPSTEPPDTEAPSGDDSPGGEAPAPTEAPTTTEAPTPTTPTGTTA